MLAHAPLAIPQGTQLRGPSGSLRCSIYRGYSQTRFAQTPRASFSRQPCATRPLRWGLVGRAITDFGVQTLTKQPQLKATPMRCSSPPFQAAE